MKKENKVIEERPVVFRNKRGQKLFGVLHLPLTDYLSPIVIMAHGFTDDKTGDNRLFVKFARKAAEGGMAVLRFDFAGSGDSEGDFSQTTVISEIEDLAGAVDFVYTLAEIDTAQINLIGYSLGGAVSIIFAANDLRIKSFIGWAPVSFLPATFRRILGNKVFFLRRRTGLVACGNGNKQFYLKKDFFNDLEAYDLAGSIKKIAPRPIVLVQGSLDKKVLSKETQLLFQSAEEPKRIYIVKDAGHAFAYYEDKLIDITLQNLRKWNDGN